VLFFAGLNPETYGQSLAVLDLAQRQDVGEKRGDPEWRNQKPRGMSASVAEKSKLILPN
jgi:hypothetical protein